MRKKILSYGGGLDSSTMLIDAIQRDEPPDLVIFADVGSGGPEDFSKDGEWISTYDWAREIAAPLCERNRIPFVWLTHKDYPLRHSKGLFEYLNKIKSIPTRKSRLCTSAAKVERIQQWIKDHIREPHEVWIGFSAGEEDRSARDPHSSKTCGDVKYRINRFPLMERKLCRCRSELLVRQAGYPVPRKSACMFCPFGRRVDFKNLQRQVPDFYEEIVKWEAESGYDKKGRKFWLTGVSKNKFPTGRPLPVMMRGKIQYEEIECLVCGRMPRAVKNVGIDFLSEKEFVAVHEPGPPIPESRKKYEKGKQKGQMIPFKKRVTFENPSGWLSMSLTSNEYAAAIWLLSRIGAGELLQTRLVLPPDPELLNRAIEALAYYQVMVRIDNDYDGASQGAAAESIYNRILAAGAREGLKVGKGGSR